MMHVKLKFVSRKDQSFDKELSNIGSVSNVPGTLCQTPNFDNWQ